VQPWVVAWHWHWKEEGGTYSCFIACLPDPWTSPALCAMPCPAPSHTPEPGVSGACSSHFTPDARLPLSCCSAQCVEYLGNLFRVALDAPARKTDYQVGGVGRWGQERGSCEGRAVAE